jgi:hypothetical protein
MMINTRFRPLTLSLILLAFCQSLFTQGLNIKVQTIDSIAVSDSGNLVYDVNGELCNLVIIRTSIDSLKFYTSRGIEKIIRNESEYRVWIPASVRVLKISSPVTSMFDFDLPQSNFRNSVYILFLSYDLKQQISYIDTVMPLLSFNTTPPGARVSINNRYIGKTPTLISIKRGQIVNFRIRKVRYSMILGVDSIKERVNKYDILLEDITRSKRFFIYPVLNVIMDSYGEGAEFFGLSLGIIGKTGWYVSYRYLPAKKYDYEMSRFCLGITQQISKSAFLSLGTGFASLKEYENRTSYAGREPITLYQGVNLDFGITFRVLWSSIIYTGFNCAFDRQNGKIKGEGADWVLGIGFNLPVKQKKVFYNKYEN